MSSFLITSIEDVDGDDGVSAYAGEIKSKYLKKKLTEASELIKLFYYSKLIFCSREQ